MASSTTIDTTAKPTIGKTDTTLRTCVQRSLSNYFSQLGDAEPAELYDMVLAEVEAPLLEAVMSYTKGNQSRAAILLGISRGTLRKKLKIYNLD
jgi:Fis family transcriptional regulator, factor for inversion stimulation protein